MVPAPRKLLAPVQPLPPALEATVHPPTALQQAPITSKQGDGAGVQVVPTPRNRPKHPRKTVEVHEPLVAQQAPTGQGAEAQVEPVPW